MLTWYSKDESFYVEYDREKIRNIFVWCDYVSSYLRVTPDSFDLLSFRDLEVSLCGGYDLANGELKNDKAYDEWKDSRLV